jgi:hypothetical protein
MIYIKGIFKFFESERNPINPEIIEEDKSIIIKTKLLGVKKRELRHTLDRR